MNPIGKVLNDKYKITELLNEGGMSLLYKAQDIEAKKIVTVKLMKEIITSI